MEKIFRHDIYKFINKVSWSNSQTTSLS